MSRSAKDEEREERLHEEIIVDAYGAEERALGWYTYLSDTLEFPWNARCVALRLTSPLDVSENVKVVGMAPEEECTREMQVLIPWKRRQLAVPLSQLEGINPDVDTQQAIDDWHYWVKRGYEF